MAQTLLFGPEGKLEVEASLTTPSGFVHKTSDGGFYYRPGQPLKDVEAAKDFPEPFKSEAEKFVSELETPPEEDEE